MKFVNPEGHPPLVYWQEVAWRWVATITAYLFLSLAYSLLSLAFQIPFSNSAAPATEVANNANEYGRASFVVFWMINYIGMIALGMACENVSMIVGQPWTALWLIFWVISNVSTAFYEIALEPKFYYWGYAWPLHNSELTISEISREHDGIIMLIRPHSRRGKQNHHIQHPFSHWSELWRAVRVVRNQHDTLRTLLLLSSVADAAAEKEGG